MSAILLASCCGCGHPVDESSIPESNPPQPPPEVTEPASVSEGSGQATADKQSVASPSTAAEASASPTAKSSAATSEAKSSAKTSAEASAPKEEIKPEPKSKPMPSPSLVPNPDATPVSFWQAAPAKTLRSGKANDAKWEKFSVPNCRYAVQLPGNMNVATPEGFPHPDSRLIWPAGAEVKDLKTTKMMLVPWSMFKQNVMNEEIKKAEVSWFFSPDLVQSATLTNQAQLKVGNYPAIRNTYSVIPLNEKNGDAIELQLVATYVGVGNDCVAIVMSCPQAKASQMADTYERIVKSLAVSSSAPKLQSPPPDRSPKDKAPKGAYPGGNTGAAQGTKPQAPPQGNLLKPNMPLPSVVTEPTSNKQNAGAKAGAGQQSKSNSASK